MKYPTAHKLFRYKFCSSHGNELLKTLTKKPLNASCFNQWVSSKKLILLEIHCFNEVQIFGDFFLDITIKFYGRFSCWPLATSPKAIVRIFVLKIQRQCRRIYDSIYLIVANTEICKSGNNFQQFDKRFKVVPSLQWNIIKAGML